MNASKARELAGVGYVHAGDSMRMNVVSIVLVSLLAAVFPSACTCRSSPGAPLATGDKAVASTERAVASAGPIVAPQPTSANIVVDQLGYRTAAEKVAVIRSPQVGFDARTVFMPEIGRA